MSAAPGLRFQLLTSWFASKEENARFDIQNVCMTSLLKRISAEMGLRLPRPWSKVNVEYGPDKRDGVMYGVPPYWTVECTRDIRDFFTLDEMGKRRFAWALMRDALELCAPALGGEARIFDPAFLEIERLNFKNRFLWKTKASRDRKTRASVFVEYTSSSIDITADLDTPGVARDQPHRVASISPNEFAIHEMLGDIKLETEQGPVIVSRSGQSFVPLMSPHGAKLAEL